MTIPVSAYVTIIFDCDGVVLHSNRVKTNAFYQTALPYGERAAKAMVDYHVNNGGVSRYRKFAHFLDEIVPLHAPNSEGPGLEGLLERYAEEVQQGLLECEVARGLEDLRKQTFNARWLIVSGGDQAELRQVFAKRGLADFFDGGVFGSPDNKDEILARELSNGSIRYPALFLGDSRYDYQAAHAAKLDFVFVSGWTETADWRGWSQQQGIYCINSLSELLSAVN